MEFCLRKAMLVACVVLIPALLSAQNVVEDETCLDCHDDIEHTVNRGPHALASLQANPATQVACISCHEGGEVHIDDPTVDNITNPSRLEGHAAREACSGCHLPHAGLDNYGFDIHSELAFNCTSCHQVHGSSSRQLISDDATFCLKCHEEKKSSFARRSQHPVWQRNLTCLSCHRFLKRADSWTGVEFERLCQDCHPEQAGPFPFEHPAVNAYEPEGSGCLQCHDPHDAENDRLLRQPYEQLCRNCHLEPVGHRMLPALHGQVGDIDNCYACHSQVHGSFTSPNLLDPNLQSRLGSAQDCSLCHEWAQ